jgi:hypothetical protein
VKDMQVHLEKLRTQIAECEMIRDLATDPEKRELFKRLANHFRVLAYQIESVMRGREGIADTFLGRRTQTPLPNEEEL